MVDRVSIYNRNRIGVPPVAPLLGDALNYLPMRYDANGNQIDASGNPVHPAPPTSGPRAPQTTTPATTTPTATTGGIKPFPGFQDFGMAGFPYRNLLEQLAASMATPSGGTYGRFGAATTTAPGGGGLLGSGGGGFTGNTGGGGLLGTGGFVPDPGNADPGFGAAPSSAAFSSLTDADKAYLWKMKEQYRQDMRALPGSHQLYFDLFGSQATPEQINALIGDTGYNNPILPGFNVNEYQGPLKQMYAGLVQQGGGTVNPYGTSPGSTYRPSVPGGMVDYRQYFGPGGPGYAGR